LALCRQTKRITVTIIATYVLPKKGEGNSISTSNIAIQEEIEKIIINLDYDSDSYSDEMSDQTDDNETEDYEWP
jgi:hypothetical protein